MPANSKSPHVLVRKPAPVVFYAVMFCLLIPIGAFAIWGTQNERPRRLFYWDTLTGQQPYLLAFENGPTKAKLYCINLQNGSMKTRPIGRVVNSLSISNFGTQMWAYDFQTKDRGALQISGNARQYDRADSPYSIVRWRKLCIDLRRKQSTSSGSIRKTGNR